MKTRKHLQKEMALVETMISKLLRIGTAVSSIIIVVGFIWFIVSGENGHPGKSYPTSFMVIFSGLLALKPLAIVMTGLLCLILIPVLRVVLSFFIFLKERDYPYMMITATVFVILMISFFLGKK